jgi:deoxyguanosine kinase
LKDAAVGYVDSTERPIALMLGQEGPPNRPILAFQFGTERPRQGSMLFAIEGCVGAGKSTVARGLAEYRRSRLLLEDFESNPFLRSFYKDPFNNALETEFAFLLLHFHQLKKHASSAQSSELIADFHLGKDLLYAELNLKDARAKRAFSDLYAVCMENTPPLALLIFLSVSTDLLIQRVRARKRDFELEIDPRYYGSVNNAYEEYFKQYAGKKLRIRMDEWDFLKDPTLYKQLAEMIDRELAKHE